MNRHKQALKDTSKVLSALVTVILVIKLFTLALYWNVTITMITFGFLWISGMYTARYLQLGDPIYDRS